MPDGLPAQPEAVRAKYHKTQAPAGGFGPAAGDLARVRKARPESVLRGVRSARIRESAARAQASMSTDRCPPGSP